VQNETLIAIENELRYLRIGDRAELDRVLANGDHKRGRGRPRRK